MFKLSKNSIKNMDGIHIDLKTVIHRAIEITKIDFGIPSTGGKRTQDEQHALFKDGKSKADGYRRLSAHQLGDAVDFYAYVDGKASWDEHHLAMAACAIMQAGHEMGVRIAWGGLFKKFKDMPHIYRLK